MEKIITPTNLLVVCGLILVFIFLHYFRKLRTKPKKGFNKYQIVIRDAEGITIFNEVILAENYSEAKDYAVQETPQGGKWIVVKF